VFLVLLVMLTWREALIAGLSIPISFLGALAVIWMLGYSLNEMVLIGMVLALGLLVDVFILMMEGMHESIFVDRLTFGQSALRTIRRYGLPAFAGQMTTVLALTPLIAIGGVAGKFIRILPITTITCLLLSFIVAVAIDVPLSRYLLSRAAQRDERPALVDRISLTLSTRLANWAYRYTVSNRLVAAAWVVAAFAIFGITAAAFSTLPALLYTESDGRNLGVTIELPGGTTLERSQACADLVGEILRNKPYLESTVKLVGRKSPMAQGALADALAPSEAAYLVGFSCVFTPRNQRDRMAFEYVDELRAEITDAVDRRFPGANVTLLAETGEPEPGDPIQLEIIGDDMEVLRQLSNEVQLALERVPGAV